MFIRAIFFSVFMLAASAGAQGLVSDELLCAEKSRLDNRLRFRVNPNIYHGYDILHHRCFWRINPKRNGRLRGYVTSQVKISRNADSIGFDMKSHLLADSVTMNGQKIRFTRSGDIIYCFKPGGWQGGSTDSLTIHYNGNPALFGGTGYYVYDFHATGPSVHTLSQPYGASFWWPCKQTLSDKIDSIDLIISTHPDFRAASNGMLIADNRINDTTAVYHWKHRYPIATYLVAIAITNYVPFTQYARFHNRPDSLMVLNYVFPQSEAGLRKDAEPIVPMIRLFDSLFGEYPFMKEKYGHAQFTWGGGMEHQTMSFMVNFSFDLMAHELAHMWFGDKVTCGSWNDLWLNEGFATYLTAIAFHHMKGKEAGLDALRGIRSSATSADDGSIFPGDTVTVNRLFSGRLTYNKAAFVLHMLRVKVGDDAFFRACKQFLGGPRAYGFATTNDLKTLMEQESGMNLDTFFMRWYRGEGFPYLSVNWSQKGRNLTVSIRQRPSHMSVPIFDLQIPIQFKGANRDTLLVFSPRGLEERFDVKLPFAADTAIFDPEVTVLARASVGGINMDKVRSEPAVILGNPVSGDKLDIVVTNLKAESIEIFNTTGQLCLSRAGLNHSPGDVLTIDIRDMTPGTYVTRIYTQNQLILLKFNLLK